MSKVFIIGGGAAGMLAAVIAARNKNEVHIVEKNDKLGKKLYITGKGRCNITNLCEEEEFLDNVVRNKHFMYSSIYSFNPYAVVDFFNSLGLKTKKERGSRIFPVSDKSSDVIKALTLELKRLGVKIHYKSNVSDILISDNKVIGMVCAGKRITCDKLIVATGGLSYASTGSDGSGHKMLANIGHSIISCEQGLVPFNISNEDIKSVTGLSLKNVKLTIKKNKRVLFEKTGEMLLTHFGISGPIVLSASSFIKNNELPARAYIDLKPYIDEKEPLKRLNKDFQKNAKKDFINSLDMIPISLSDLLIKRTGIDPRKKTGSLTKEEKSVLIDTIKNLSVDIISKRSFSEAVITIGGVCTKEVNPSTMESKIVSNLFIVGELLDVDALTGGYNLQVAFSTAYLAGMNV